MSNHLDLELRLPVINCSACCGNHDEVHFLPYREEGWTHRGVCPVNDGWCYMNVLASPRVWENLLQSAGVTNG